MTFDELRDELSARGFAHLSTVRLGLLINRARSRLDGLHDWFYTEDSAQGAAPLSIPTLRRVEAVSNETTGQLLEQSSYADILDLGGTDLTGSGSPTWWYLSSPSGTPVVNTYPDNSDTIGVQFWARTPTLTADADEPLAPEDFHLLYVDIAQQMAERDRGNYAEAQALQVDIDRQVNEMVEQLLPQQSALYQRISVWNSDDW